MLWWWVAQGQDGSSVHGVSKHDSLSRLKLHWVIAWSRGALMGFSAPSDFSFNLLSLCEIFSFSLSCHTSNYSQMALPVNIQTGLLCMEAFLVYPSNRTALSELFFSFGCLYWLSCCCPCSPGVARASHKPPERQFPKGASQPCCQMCLFSKLCVLGNTKFTEGCRINDIQRWMWLLCLSHFSSLFYKAGGMHLTMPLMAPMGKKLLISHFDFLPFAQEMWQ